MTTTPETPVPATFEGGPFIAVATFCERVLTEQDSVQSAIRMVDRVFRAVGGPDAPDDLQKFQYSLWYLLILKAGRARGRHRISFDFERPDALRRTLFEQDALFEGEDRGVSFGVQMNMEFEQEGLYWLHVMIEGTEVTRSPLRIVYQRTRLPMAPPAPGPSEPPGPET